MTAELPAAVRSAVAAMLEGVSRTALAKRAAALSDRYRAGQTSAVAIGDRADALAYIVARMPATYAAVAAALAEAHAALPELAPASLLDAGSGPGTAAFAATAAWPTIAGATLIDASRPFMAIAGDLAAVSGNAALAACQRILGDAERLGRDLPRADLVIAAYLLAESARPADLTAALWRAARQALVLVEPGTPDGYARIRAARAALIAAGAVIAAPCPHDRTCPIVAPDWCHFAVRLARSRDHRLAKAADAPFEDEKFSYVVAVRPDVRRARTAARILAPPRTTKADMRLKLCRADGTIAERAVPRRDKAAFAAIRRSAWGDALGSRD